MFFFKTFIANSFCEATIFINLMSADFPLKYFLVFLFQFLNSYDWTFLRAFCRACSMNIPLIELWNFPFHLLIYLPFNSSLNRSK